MICAASSVGQRGPGVEGHRNVPGVEGMLVEPQAEEGQEIQLHRSHGEAHAVLVFGREGGQPLLQQVVGQQRVRRLGVGVLGVPFVPDRLRVHVAVEAQPHDGGARSRDATGRRPRSTRSDRPAGGPVAGSAARPGRPAAAPRRRAPGSVRPGGRRWPGACRCSPLRSCASASVGRAGSLRRTVPGVVAGPGQPQPWPVPVHVSPSSMARNVRATASRVPSGGGVGDQHAAPGERRRAGAGPGSRGHRPAASPTSWRRAAPR